MTGSLPPNLVLDVTVVAVMLALPDVRAEGLLSRPMP